MLELVAVLNTKCRSPFQDHVAEMMLEREDERFVCMITDSLWHVAQDVAAQFKIPRVALRTSGAAASVAMFALELLGEKGYYQIQGMCG